MKRFVTSPAQSGRSRVSRRGARVAATCDSLAALALKDTTITLRSARAGGPVLGSGRAAAGRGANPYKDLPEFCRVAATLKPTSDSDIKVEVWLPADRLERQVPGGRQRRLGRSDQLFRDGRRRPRGVCERVHRHRACGRPRDLCARSSRKADRLRLALRARDDREGQGRHPGVLRQRARGCPTGTAARPAGGRASRKRRNFRTTTTASSPARRPTGRPSRCGLPHAVLKDPASYIPPAKYPIIHQAALAACDARDGLKDGLIDDPDQVRLRSQGAALQRRRRSRRA